jgi:HlyD family secretion protein
VRNNQASVELAQANEKRIRQLYAQEYVSKQELDTAVQVLRSAKAQLDSARGLLARDQTNLNFTIIRSPVSGVVVDRVVDVGQTVAASFQTPTLIKIAQDLSKMQINSSFAEADIGNIKVGQVTKFNVDAYPNRNFEGVVKQVRLNPTNTSNVVTYDVVISVDNNEQLLLPGMTAYVNIGVAKREQAWLVPNAALRYKPKLDNNTTDSAKNEPRKNASGRKKGNKGSDLNTGSIYILKDGKPLVIKVRTGITDGRYTEITGQDLKTHGINIGTQVIVAELQGNGQAQTGSNMRGPRMF